MVGIKSLNGLPLIYRDSQYASRGFKIDSDLFKGQALIPRPKFLFFVKFNRATGEGNLTTQPRNTAGDLNRFSNTKTGIVFQVKTVDKPKFNIRTDTLHQYNKKRIIQTRIDYNPMTIQFHDDINDQVLKFWTEYYSFYYGDVTQTSSSSWRDDIVSRDFDEGNGNGWGYKGAFANGSPNRMHFLDNIELVQFYGAKMTIMTFVHPKITSFDHDSSDYSDGTTGTGITIQFDYEGVLYKTGVELKFADAEQFGFNEATYRLLDEQSVRRAPAGGQGKISNIFSGIIGSLNLPQTRIFGNFGAAAITNRIVSEATSRVSAGSRTLSGSGISFGTGALGQFSGNVGSLVNATSLIGLVPSPDLIQKETGVKSTINNFGVFQSPTIDNILTNPRTINNTGIDSAKVTEAASLINSSASSEVPTGPGQTTIADPKSLNLFSRAFGTGAALARNQGIVSDIATHQDSITSESGNADTMINKLPDGKYQLTDKGAAVMNSLRTPNSSLGSRRPVNPWTNPDAVDSNRRNLDAEKDEFNPLDISNLTG